MELSQFDFDLPSDLIADRPVSPRETSRMLVGLEPIQDAVFTDFTDYIGKKDLVIVNNSKVMPTYMIGSYEGKQFKITFHKQIDERKWLAFIKPGKKIKLKCKLDLGKNVSCKVISKKSSGEFELITSLDDKEFMKFILEKGFMPLPPYIQKIRKSDKQDFIDYQTVYAREYGSVAAPTAGLHFNDATINELKKREQIEEITLHVGAGTFMPIRNNKINDHKIHSESGTITADVIQRIKDCKSSGGKIISVGTTTLRLLESAFSNEDLNYFDGETNIFIKPGYKFKIVDILLTNFHLPKSSLMLLVSAFAGFEKIQALYKHAIQDKYRFFSYGDVSLLFKNE